MNCCFWNPEIWLSVDDELPVFSFNVPIFGEFWFANHFKSGQTPLIKVGVILYLYTTVQSVEQIINRLESYEGEKNDVQLYI